MKRILFVDDEANLLDGLRRMLRPQRSEWDMAFALGANEALKILEGSHVDVIVSDMRMPGMDGAHLLQRVHDVFPNVLRIILSGHFDSETGLRAVPAAHQFLTKPCEPRELKAAIERSYRMNRTGLDDATERFVAAIGALPPPPRVCALLLEAIESPEVSIAAVRRIMDQDVLVAARILQLVRSDLFGLPQDVSNLVDAVSLLGNDVMRQVILAAGVSMTFAPAREVRGFSINQFEMHSHLTARIASRLSKDTAPAEVSGVPAALLHDAGKLVLASSRPRELEEAIAQSATENRPLHECEVELFGTSHAEIGGYMLELWGLPPSTVDAIVFHHRPSAGPGFEAGRFDLRALVHIANALAHEHAQESAEWGVFPSKADRGYLEELGVAHRIPEWRARIRQAGSSGLNRVR